MKAEALRQPFLRRVPLLLLVVAGVVLWQSALFPQPRTLLWELPESLEVVRAEVQLWRGSELLARGEWPSHPVSPLVQQLQLKAGTYRALAFLELSDGRVEQRIRTVQVGHEQTVRVSLQSR